MLIYKNCVESHNQLRLYQRGSGQGSSKSESLGPVDVQPERYQGLILVPGILATRTCVVKRFVPPSIFGDSGEDAAIFFPCVCSKTGS